MKVRVVVTLDIDREAWMREFGIDRDKVREDVQSYFETTCHGQLDAVGLRADSKSG